MRIPLFIGSFKKSIKLYIYIICLLFFKYKNYKKRKKAVARYLFLPLLKADQ